MRSGIFSGFRSPKRFTIISARLGSRNAGKQRGTRMAEYVKGCQRENSGVGKRLARHGHVSYLEIPAADAENSAAFYEAVFGWAVERRENGQRSFDDGSGDLIGRWVTSRI